MAVIPECVAPPPWIGSASERGALSRIAIDSAAMTGRNRTRSSAVTNQPYPPHVREIRLTRYPHGESNPGFRAENPTSWASRRWGRAEAEFPALVLAVSDGVSSRLEQPLFCRNSRHFIGLI